MPRLPLFPRLVSLAIALVLNSCGETTSPDGGTEVSPPEFSVSGGVYYEPHEVTISSATAGAQIYYTVNGDTPSVLTARYTGPIRSSQAYTLQAIAVKDGMAPSPVRSEKYAIQPTEWIQDIPWNAEIAYGKLDYAGQSYRTVRIGTQHWMAENLNYKGIGPDTVGACYNGVSVSCDKFGRLYRWIEAMSFPDSCMFRSCKNLIQPRHRGICPPAWHLPTDEEWAQLKKEFGGDSSKLGTALKSTAGWATFSWGLPGTGSDTVGFRALPAGMCVTGGRSECLYGGREAMWWTATEAYVPGGIYWAMASSYVGMYGLFADEYRHRFYSVRCLEDQ